MRFLVVPALDLAAGRLARFTRSGPASLEAFGGDPVAAGEALVAAGAGWLHVVDMDLAFEGTARNLSVLSRLAELGARVQAAGGLSARAEVDAMLEAGASRAVLGSAALHDPRLVASLVEDLGDRLAVGVEIDGDRIRPRGRSAPELELEPTVAWLAELAPTRFVVTDVRRVGALEGPDLEGLAAFTRRVARPVLASGGVASRADLAALATTGVEGAVVGRALLEGDLGLDVLSTTIG